MVLQRASEPFSMSLLQRRDSRAIWNFSQDQQGCCRKDNARKDSSSEGSLSPGRRELSGWMSLDPNSHISLSHWFSLIVLGYDTHMS